MWPRDPQVHAEWLEPQVMMLWGAFEGRVGIKVFVESRYCPYPRASSRDKIARERSY